MEFLVREGDYAKMGAYIGADGVTFTFEGEKEDACSVVLIEKKTKEEFLIEVPQKFCLGSLRSVKISGFSPENFYYEYNINGESILDPYARSISGREIWNNKDRIREELKVYGKILQTEFDWSNDHQPEIKKSKMIMYKLHARGFTMDHGAEKRIAGTFQGILSRLSYLKELGVTTVELMPVYEFEELVLPKKPELPEYINWEQQEEDIILPEEEQKEQEARLNYWGYGEGNYFAVKASYAAEPQNASFEFKQLVHEMHKMGMECILEMYFPVTINHNLILDALRYWVREFHVDGFHLLGERIPITAIVQDVLLSRTKIFYHQFEHGVQKEDKKYKNLYVYEEEYQYPARKILNHINGNMQEFINQQKKQGSTLGYVNFIASNNGFTLSDVFMYNDRHNEENGENNVDGNAWNFSNNYGVEGPTRKKYIQATRKRQWRNAMMMLFLAQGVPLLWAGDEMCNSQNGNNNAYCQDNPVGWLNWKNEKSHKEETQFVKKLIQFRNTHSLISNELPFHFNDYKTLGAPDLSFHGENAWIMGIDPGRMNLGMMYYGAYSRDEEKEDIYVAYNFFSAVSTLALPKLEKKKKWYVVIDSAMDENPVMENPVLASNQKTLSMMPQSICILVGK